MTKDCTNPVFICGCPRSGTTALWNALRKHPNLAPAPGKWNDKELWFFEELFAGRAGESAARREYKLDKIFEKEAVLFVNSFMSRYCSSASGRYMTANLQIIFNIQRILDQIPDAKFILILRHPQENVWSLLNAYFAAGWIRKSRDPRLITQEEIIAATKLWKKSADVIMPAMAGEYARSAMVVRQEDMILRPQELAAELLKFLKEPYESAVAESLSGGIINSSFAEGTKQGQSSFLHVQKVADDEHRVQYFDRIRGQLAARKDICSTVVTLVGKEMQQLGYTDYALQREKYTGAAPTEEKPAQARSGEITDVSLLNKNGVVQSLFTAEEPMAISVTALAHKAVNNPSVGFFVRNKDQIRIFGTTSFDEKLKLPNLNSGESLTVTFHFNQMLRAGTYYIGVAFNSVAARDYSDNVLHDEIDGIKEFSVTYNPNRPIHYTFLNPVKIQFQKGSPSESKAVKEPV